MSNKGIDVIGDRNIVAGGDIILPKVRMLPSLLGRILPILMERIDAFKEVKNPPSVPYKIDQKIDFNNLNSYRKSIEEYSIYGNIVDSTYENLDLNNPGAKRKIFQYLGKKYTDAKAEYITNTNTEFRILKTYSDKIFKNTMLQIKRDLQNSKIKNITMEELEICVLVITCHGFINCKILENVPNDC